MSVKRKYHNKTYIFKGIPINGGKVCSKVCLFAKTEHRTIPEWSLESPNEIQEEIEKYERSLRKFSIELEKAAENVEVQVGKAEAEIFLAQKHILFDQEIQTEIREIIQRDKKNAEYAVDKVFRKYERRFEELENTYLRERVTDIKDIRRGILNFLRSYELKVECAGHNYCRWGKHRVIVTSQLSPGMIVKLDYAHVNGFVTEHGGPSSHAAIISRSLGIPAVSGAHKIMSVIQCGDTIILDGDTGTVYLNPDPNTIKRLACTEEKTPRIVAVQENFKTPEGMHAFANVSFSPDLDLALKYNADGIGLFRTEFAFIKAKKLLSEQEQYEIYSDVVKQMPGKPITFRLLDVGGDKPLPNIGIEEEENPYLGLRGARFLLNQKEILKCQVRALLRTSLLGKVKILFPMIIDYKQLEKLYHIIMHTSKEVEHNPENITYGAMFEVPSACMQADKIMKLVDFANIGSNDLIQYLFAVDRNNEYVSNDYDPEHPILWEMLENLSQAAEKNRKPICICGEIAGMENLVSKLLQIGLTSLSVAPRLIPFVRREMIEYSKRKVQ